MQPCPAVWPATGKTPRGVCRSDGGVVAPLGDGVFGGHLSEGSLSGDVMRWQGEVDDTLGIEQFFVQSWGEPQWRLKGWGVEGKV